MKIRINKFLSFTPGFRTCTNGIIVIIIFSFGFLLSCNKDKPAPPPPDLGYSYFPLAIGSWIIYDVDSIVHDDFKDTVILFQYQLKEKVESKFIDNSGKEVFRIERYKRIKSNDPWTITDVWAADTTKTRAERFEENTWYVKLVFPVKLNARWNGNGFNSMEEIDYEFTEVNVPGAINGNSFDSTLTVTQSQEPNAITQFFGEEKYAKNVGMIYRKYINLSLDENHQPVSGLEQTFKINSSGRD